MRCVCFNANVNINGLPHPRLCQHNDNNNNGNDNKDNNSRLVSHLNHGLRKNCFGEKEEEKILKIFCSKRPPFISVSHNHLKMQISQLSLSKEDLSKI